MTDRFYPLGMTSDPDTWKTTYEVQGEMRSFARSAYPPGCAVHLPGQREKFGFSNPGCEYGRLAQPHLQLKEETDVKFPRAHHAVPRHPEEDDRATFESHDVPEMRRTAQSPVAGMSLSASGFPKMRASRSSPTLRTTGNWSRLSAPQDAIDKLEDEHFTYFVPRSLQGHHRDKLYGSTLSKLQKTNRVTMPFSGDGTGFRCQSSNTPWWPAGTIDSQTSYRSQYNNPEKFRISPLKASPGAPIPF